MTWRCESISICVLLLTSQVGCRAKQDQSVAPAPDLPHTVSSNDRQDIPRKSGSLISLIGRPEYFRGADVAVSGYLVLDRERFPGFDGFLFLRKKDAELGFLNGVFVGFRPCSVVVKSAERPVELTQDSISRYSDNYVHIYGSFQPPTPSRASQHSTELGVICDIKNVIVRQMKPPETQQ